MPKIVVTNPIFPEVETRLRDLGEVVINERGPPWSRNELLDRLHDADAMLMRATSSFRRRQTLT